MAQWGIGLRTGGSECCLIALEGAGLHEKDEKFVGWREWMSAAWDEIVVVRSFIMSRGHRRLVEELVD
jgi:hypothetical protein